MKKTQNNEKTVKRSSSITEEPVTKDYKKQNKELIARVSCAEMELAKLQVEKEAFESKEKALKEKIRNLKSQHEIDELKIKELNYTISQLQKNLHEISNSTNEANKDSQRALEKLKFSLNEVESVVSYRTSTSRRHLAKITRIVTSFLQNSAEASPVFRASLKKFSKEVLNTVEELGKIMNTNNIESFEESFKESLREKDQTIEEYRKILEKMREQMQLLRERVKELENKKNYSENDKKVKVLIQEKDTLTKHISSLEQSLKEQSLFMESLKEAIFVDDEKNDIDQEIALVDQEIIELQCSLERALS